MMNQSQRIQKRFKRENRKNKGVSATAKSQAHNARVRDARRKMGGWQTQDEFMLLLAASMMGKK